MSPAVEPTTHDRIWGVTPVIQAIQRRKVMAGTPRVNRRPPPPPPVAARPPQPPPPPLVAPPLPSGAARVAELATSMLWAAPTSALVSSLVLPLYLGMGVDTLINPSQLAYLFTLVLLGSWMLLAVTKLWEGKVVDASLAGWSC